jgi:hypothetical protein
MPFIPQAPHRAILFTMLFVGKEQHARLRNDHLAGRAGLSHLIKHSRRKMVAEAKPNTMA